MDKLFRCTKFDHINFKKELQISNNDLNKQRQVKRIARDRCSTHLREDRFLFTSLRILINLSVGFFDGFHLLSNKLWKNRRLQWDRLPSKDPKTNLLGFKCQGEKLANINQIQQERHSFKSPRKTNIPMFIILIIGRINSNLDNHLISVSIIQRRTKLNDKFQFFKVLEYLEKRQNFYFLSFLFRQMFILSKWWKTTNEQIR